MDPALERLYVEEVLHLHSLWHRGPPRKPNPNPNPNLNPNPTLRPASSTAFKKEGKKKKKKSTSKREKKKQQQQPQGSAGASRRPPADPPAKEVEWPCAPTPEKNDGPATWADFAPTPAAPQIRPPSSAEEQARAAADRAQQRGLKACMNFFATKDDSDDGEEEDSMEEDEEAGEGYFKFFLGLFESDGELREYYEKNWEKGDFSCLVCGAIGVKKWKRFGDCVGLIQHSNSISKTKRREAHRAFARAVCRVLGWDITRLPSIVLDVGSSLGLSLAKAANPQEDAQKKDLPAEVEEISNEVAADAGTDKVDLMNCAAKEIEALAGMQENLQKEAEIDEKENDEEPMECIETKRITELSNEDVIDKKEKLSREIDSHGETNDGLDD